MSRFARFILFLFALPCAAFYFFGVPVGGYLLLEQAEEEYTCILFWLVFIGLMTIPVCFSFVIAQKSLSSDKTAKNHRRVRRVALTAVVTTVYFFIGNGALYLLGMFHPSVFPVGIPLAFIGVAFTVIAAVFSYVSFHANDICEDY